MSVVAADRFIAVKEGREPSYLVADNIVIYKGAIVCLNTSTGYAVVGTDAASRLFLGYAIDHVDTTANGPLGASHASGLLSVRAFRGVLMQSVECTTTAITDIGSAVYVADSGAVGLAAGSTNFVYVGTIVGWHTATSIDVAINAAGVSAPLTSISGLTATASDLNEIGGTGFALAKTTASTIQVTAANLTIGTTTSGTLTLRTVTAGNLVITSAALLQITGVGTSSLAITSGTFTLSTVTTGNIVITAAQLFQVTAVGNSSIIVTSGSMTLQTLTSGAILLTSIGAITITSATASTWAATGGLTISAGTLTISTAATGLAVTNNATVGGTLIVTGATTLDSGTAPASGAGASTGIQVGTVAGMGIYWGTGTPSFSAPTGSLYLNYAGATSTTRMWVNNSGASTTGTTWTASAAFAA